MDIINCDEKTLKALKEGCINDNKNMNKNKCIDNMNLWFYKCKDKRIVKDWFLY